MLQTILITYSMYTRTIALMARLILIELCWGQLLQNLKINLAMDESKNEKMRWLKLHLLQQIRVGMIYNFENWVQWQFLIGKQWKISGNSEWNW